KICKTFATAIYMLLLIGAVAPLARAESYRFGVSKPGGAWYPIGAAVSRLADKEYGDKVTLDIGAGLANTLNVLSGKLEFGITYSTAAVDAIQGRGPFKGKDASNLRLAMVQYPSLMFWVVWADSNIKHYQDLKGKRVSVMPRRFSAQLLNKQVLTALGISYNDFSKTHYLGLTDSVTQMKDGHIDALLMPGEEIYAPVLQLATHKPIRILSFTDEDIRKIRAVQPAVSPTTMDKKYYDQPKDVHTLQNFQIILTHKNVPENLVYKLAKLMYGNLSHFIKVNQSFRHVKVKDAARDLGIPPHPGLTRYLKEVGAL
ncbi:TAXI family TRAP transporter solute-binding subunit, partial [Acidobacteria bacterium AH-259-D05]|nr:TAXI family TRAP transporter solute-binding subunit [Acidobacteria bacterium AH-259-D05]